MTDTPQNKADVTSAVMLPRMIDEFIGKNVERMFGKEVTKLFVESRTRIPGIEVNIHNKPMGNYTETTVVLVFHNQVIDQKKIFVI